ncbi:MAG: DUF4412 domain-containing protein [Cyclobacteriaceae bacterium]
MKYLTLILFCLSGIASAQQFEGTITWTINAKITDPKMKAQMEEAEKRMNDPEMQAQMKQMQEQMNNPQMKAMMESNPQMKAQMEKIMSMSNGGGMESMIPKSMVIKVKNDNTLSVIEGGMMSGEVLYLKDKGTSYHIDREAQTYSILGKDNGDASKMNAKVSKTGESAKVAAYTCQKYKIEITEQGKSMTQYVWATTEIKGIDLKGLANQKMNGGRSVFYSEIDGVPLKMEMTTPEMVMTMEAKEVKKESLSASQFIIPSNFKEVKGMMSGN